MLQLTNPLDITKKDQAALAKKFPMWPIRAANSTRPLGLSMIVNRLDKKVDGDDISAYYAIAEAQLKEFHAGVRESLTWILQGQDQNTGCSFLVLRAYL